MAAHLDDDLISALSHWQQISLHSRCSD